MSNIQMEATQRKIDTVLNKTFLDLATFSLIGYTIGIGASLFFRRSAPIRNFAAGIGGSYAIVQNKTSFHQLI